MRARDSRLMLNLKHELDSRNLRLIVGPPAVAAGVLLVCWRALKRMSRSGRRVANRE